MSEILHELVVEGPPPLVKGFAAGFLAAMGLALDEIVFCEEIGIQCESKLHQLAEWMHLQRQDTHLLVREPLVDQLREGLEGIGKEVGLVLRADRLVVSASFSFNYVAYNRKMAKTLDDLVRSHADQVRVSDDYQPVEWRDPSAAAVELYGPVHEYEVRAQGTLTGPVRLILGIHRESKNHAMMSAEPVVLNHADS